MNVLYDKLKALEAKYLYMILAGVIAVVIIVDCALLIRLQLKWVSSLDARIVQLDKDIIDLTTNKQRLVQFESQLEAARRKRKNFDAMIHRKGQVPAVLKSISGIANEYGVNIVQLIPQPAGVLPLAQDEDGKYYTMNIVIRARSGYHQFGKFLSRMERGRLFWQIGQFSIVADPKDSQRQDIKMDMNILVLEK